MLDNDNIYESPEEFKYTQPEITITRVDNGIIMKCANSDMNEHLVFEQQNNSQEEDYSFYIPLFYKIMDYFGDFPNKHREKNITIKYE